MRPRKVSIVLPTHNGMPLFSRVLDGILAQRCSFPFELYCVDTASADGTWEELERRNVRRKRIAKSEFDHGRTRNQAISETDGDVIVCMVQDATPADEHWLEALVSAYDAIDDVAGAYSRQVPYPDCSPFLKHRLERWAAGRTERQIQRLAPGESLAQLEPMQRLFRCAFDDVASSMRREVWRRFPLPSRRFGEDVAWAKSVIEAGLALVFEPRSTVIHSHDDGAWAEAKRIYLDHANLHDLFGVLTVPTFADARRNSRAQFGVYRAQVDALDLPPRERDAQLRFARRLAYGETFAQWLGARSVRKGPPRGIFRWIEHLVTGK
ncbi:MAG: glycosyltransferase [Planctomycetes bacterium]|nr:glycosyltransferase [Planctomycetota bacterium]MCC7172321.1 glycosyltransferase [Planctomycetota bacterium]